MDFLELAKKRYSERRFDNRPIEGDILEKILEAGRIAPTGCNYQPQRFYLLKSEDAFEKLNSITRYRYGAPIVILVCYDLDAVWKNPKDRLFSNYNSGEQDASIAAATMMYEAESVGVHSLWIRGFDARSVAEVFELSDNIMPVMMLALGYPSENSRPSDWHYIRKPIDEFITEL